MLNLVADLIGLAGSLSRQYPLNYLQIHCTVLFFFLSLSLQSSLMLFSEEPVVLRGSHTQHSPSFTHDFREAALTQLGHASSY